MFLTCPDGVRIPQEINTNATRRAHLSDFPRTSPRHEARSPNAVMSGVWDPPYECWREQIQSIALTFYNFCVFTDFSILSICYFPGSLLFFVHDFPQFVEFILSFTYTLAQLVLQWALGMSLCLVSNPGLKCSSCLGFLSVWAYQRAPQRSAQL